MADEFIKGLGIATIGGFGWMILSGWYTTPGFDETQLIAPPPENPDFYGELALMFREALFWFMIIGMVTFWVIIPAIKQLKNAQQSDA